MNWLGSHVPQVFRRIVCYADGWVPIDITPQSVAAARKRLDDLAEAAGRDPRSIEITAFGIPADRQVVMQYERAGADRVVVNLPTANRPDSLSWLDRIESSVL